MSTTGLGGLSRPYETKSLLPHGPDRIRTPASYCSQFTYGIKQFSKAALSQAVAFGPPMLMRSLAHEVYHEFRDSPMGDALSLGLTAACLAGTLLFDQTYIANAIHNMRSWLGTTPDGVPGQPSQWKSQGLALVPTLFSAALVVRELYGDGYKDAPPLLMAGDMAALMWGWPAGRLLRDLIQQGLNGCLPTLKMVNEHTGADLTPAQKKAFDDSRLGWQTAGYTAVVFFGAFVTVPALRLYFGADERSPDLRLAVKAMAASMVNSALVEGTDELISLAAHRFFGPRQVEPLEMQITQGTHNPDWLERGIDHGGLRALMGNLVTNLAQLLGSANRNHDVISDLATAISSVAISLMEIRGKSVTVHRDYAANSDAYKHILRSLIAETEHQSGHTLDKKGLELVHTRMCEFAQGMNDQSGARAPFKDLKLWVRSPEGAGRWLDGKQDTAPLSKSQQEGLGDLEQRGLYLDLPGNQGRAFFLRANGSPWTFPASAAKTDSKERPGTSASGEVPGVLPHVDSMVSMTAFSSPLMRSSSSTTGLVNPELTPLKLQPVRQISDGQTFISAQDPGAADVDSAQTTFHLSPEKQNLSPRPTDMERTSEQRGATKLHFIQDAQHQTLLRHDQLVQDQLINLTFQDKFILANAIFQSIDGENMRVKVPVGTHTNTLPVVQAGTDGTIVSIAIKS